MPSLAEQKRNSIDKLIENLDSLCSDLLGERRDMKGIHGLAFVVNVVDLLPLLEILNENKKLDFDFLVDLTVVDWLDEKKERFEIIYQLLSHKHLYRLCIRVPLLEDKPELPTSSGIWKSALFMEREAWDMFGINFLGHPDLKRILMYEEFEGHPLRKDYPILKKQPRVKMRLPELHNTAKDMYRPPLVQISSAGKFKDKENG